MKQYTAEYYKYGQTGTSICCADDISSLIETLYLKGYEFDNQKEIQEILNWDNTNKKKYYGTRLTIRRGELEMTEYTSF